MIDLSEPLATYKLGLKRQYNDEVEKYWKELIETADTDTLSNESTCKEYYSTKALKEKTMKDLGTTRGVKNFFIGLGVVASIVGLILLVLGYNDNPKKTALVVTGVIVIVCGIIVAILAVNLPKKKIKRLNDKIKELQQKEKEALDRAYTEMASLNSLYDWNIPCKIFNRLNTVVNLDPHFDVEKFQYLHDKYGFADRFDDQTSTLCIQSGSILGNPFLIVKTLEQYWYTKRYENSITIHWTTRVKTKNGWTTQHHTQVLTGYVDKPAAGYGEYTTLIYGNDAAPKLTFSRGPSGIDGKDEKQISKMIKKESKQFDKKAREAILDNDPNTNYVRFGNEEFESLFGGEDRDNEVEFRLLFTPLAQNNLIKLIRNKEGYGDDWFFKKDHKLNYIQSRHSQSFDYSANPNMFIDFDCNNAHKKFVDYNNEFFKSFYYDLAPLISIPLYQQTKTKEYIYNKQFSGNVTYYEDEMMANSFGEASFKSSLSNTRNILKTSLNRTVGEVDEVTVTAYGYQTIPHVTVVTKLGGDGRMHDIPVTWYEYVPVSRATRMAIETKKSSRQEFNAKINDPEFKKRMVFAAAGAYLYQRGLFAAILLNELSDADAFNMTNALNNNSNSNIKNNSNVVSNTTNNIIDEIKGAVDTAQSRVKTNIKNGKLNDGNDNNSNNQ